MFCMKYFFSPRSLALCSHFVERIPEIMACSYGPQAERVKPEGLATHKVVHHLPYREPRVRRPHALYGREVSRFG